MDSAKIFIDTDNEITFILEKILASRSERVCLVVPDRAAVFTSISGLKLVKRIVEKSNKLLILVTLDSNGADLAKKAGLHVVSRVGEISEDLWEQIRKSKFEIIKKDKKKVFYLPDNKVEELETNPKPESSAKKPEKINLSEIYKETFESGDSTLVVADPIEEQAEEKAEVPQVRIKVEDKEIQKPEVLEEPKEIKLKEEKNLKVDKEDNQSNASDLNIEKSRRRRSSDDSKSQLSFNEGEELKSQKKNSLGLKNLFQQ